MADKQVRMPSSGAGLTTFYEESKSKLLIHPYLLIGVVILIIIITILLNVL